MPRYWSHTISDLLAGMEVQSRAVRHTMRRVERLRSVKARIGPELSNRERHTALTNLFDELEAIDKHLWSEHECCTAMHSVIQKMQQRLARLKSLFERP